MCLLNSWQKPPRGMTLFTNEALMNMATIDVHSASERETESIAELSSAASICRSSDTQFLPNPHHL